MSQGCSICQRLDVEGINTVLRQGTPVRAVARQFQIPKSTLLRHSEHVSHTQKGAPSMPTETLTESPSPAQMEARLAGMSREVTTLRAEVERLVQQLAADHAFIVHMAELFYTIATHEGTQQKIMSLLRQDGMSPDPLSQQLRALTHQKLIPVYGTRDPKPMPPIDRPHTGTPWWHVLAVLGKSHTANEKEE